MGVGIVIILFGEWLCGFIYLCSNVNLYLVVDVILLFFENFNDYLFVVKISWEGMECYNYLFFIYVYECSNVVISGKGIFWVKLDIW